MVVVLYRFLVAVNNCDPWTNINTVIFLHADIEARTDSLAINNYNEKVSIKFKKMTKEKNQDTYFETEDMAFAAFLFSKGYNFLYVRKKSNNEGQMIYGLDWNMDYMDGALLENLDNLLEEFNQNSSDICYDCFAHSVKWIAQLEYCLRCEAEDVDALSIGHLLSVHNLTMVTR
ncbi:hypothetical protein C0583_04590 [Candidatus Parcubacteria bacterium]|nr:MAG: hypothetical protein C0583_04590 [Candidatus Parcubacteria bacterium]